jgi:multisubunit Na+/H+ antiporter MnhB subunit
VRISTAALLVSMVLIGILLGTTLRRRLRGMTTALVVGAGLLGALISFPVLQEGVFFTEVFVLERDCVEPGQSEYAG